MKKKIMLLVGIFVLSLLTFFWGNPSNAQGIPQTSTGMKGLTGKRILILDGVQEGLPQPAAQIQGLTDTFKKHGFKLKNVYIEHLDLARYPDSRHRANLTRLLRWKFAQKHIDLIIVINQQSFEFVASNLKDLMPNVPVLLENIQIPPVSWDYNKRKIINLYFQTDIAGTLDYAIKIFPDTRQLVVITGRDDRNVPFMAATAKAIAGLKKKLGVEYTENLTYEEMLRKIATLPPHTVAFLGPYFNDHTGRYFVPAEVARVVSQIANAPVFSEVDILISQGLLGGSTVISETVGKRGGQIALDYLNGDITLTQPITRFKINNIPLFNWSQLERWKVNVNKLPANSIFINRPLTLWGQYKAIVISTLLSISILIVLILALIIQNRRRKKAVKALQRSEESFRTLFEDHSAVKFVIDPTTGNIIRANHAAANYYGWPREELMQMKIQDINLLSSAEISTDMEKIRTDQQDHFEFQHRRFDGSIRDVEVFASNVEIEGRRYLHSIIHDISERKNAEAALRENRHFLELAIDGSNAGTWDLKFKPDDPPGTFGDDVYLSPRLKKMMGFKNSEFPGSLSAFEKRIVPQDLEKVMQSVQEHLSGRKELQDVQYRIRHKDGGIRWFHTRGKIRRDKAGRPVRWTGISWDITEQKNIEEAFRLSQEKHSILFETMLQGVIYHDSQGEIITANSAAEKILGLTNEKPISRNRIYSRWQIIHEDGSPFPDEQLPSWVALRTGKPQKNVSMGVFNPVENRYRWITVNTVPLFKPKEPYPFMVHTTFSDITEQKETEQILQQYLDRLKVLHEIDKAILSAQTPEVIVKKTLDRFNKLVPCTRSSIVGFDSKAEKAWVIGVHAAGKTYLGAGEKASMDMFGDVKKLALGKYNFVHDSNRMLEPSQELQRLRSEGIRSYINIPMICRGDLLGTFNIGSDILNFFTDQHIEIAREVADSISVAYQNARLMNEVVQHQKNLQRLSNHLINAQETERKRISMELHDEMGQALTAIGINLSTIEKNYSSDISSIARKVLEDTILLAEETADQIHDLSLFLRPAILDDLGLVPALRWFLNRYARRSCLEIDFQTNGFDDRLEDAVEMTIYRIVQEALNNIVKHAKATKALVRIKKNGNSIFGEIIDNGKGFNVDAVAADDSLKYGIGIIGMRERLSMLDAKFGIESHEGHGTQITIQIPVHKKKKS